MPHMPVSATRARQRGATLVMALLILVLIMMIGIAALSTSNTQFKLAGNLQFEDSATNNAEAAIAAAEAWLAPDNNSYKDPGFTTYAHGPTPQLQPVTASLNPMTMTWQDSVEDADRSQNFADSVRVAGNVSQRYFIQLMSKGNQLPGSGISPPRTSSACNKVDTFVITARGTSSRGATKYIQSYYSHKAC